MAEKAALSLMLLCCTGLSYGQQSSSVQPVPKLLETPCTDADSKRIIREAKDVLAEYNKMRAERDGALTVLHDMDAELKRLGIECTRASDVSRTLHCEKKQSLPEEPYKIPGKP
jgi:hypothetical protein